MKAAHHKGHTLKHARTAKTKHGHTSKHHPRHHAKTATKHAHHVHAKAKHATHAKAKGLALQARDAACCTAEALAMSLRIQGLAVSDAAVLELFRLAGGDQDRGLPVPVMLEAAAEYGLAVCRPVKLPAGRDLDTGSPASPAPGRAFTLMAPSDGALSVELPACPLILGVDLPGPHAVLATPEGWWSWGELYCPWCEFPDAVIDGAWAIEWAVAA